MNDLPAVELPERSLAAALQELRAAEKDRRQLELELAAVRVLRRLKKDSSRFRRRHRWHL